jgi:3-oxo-5-alpha-steroid 4-dehydrogenase 1
VTWLYRLVNSELTHCCSLQAQSLCQFQFYPDDWLYSSQCLLGIVLFVTGMAINCHSDAILRKLRRASSKYQLPKGGLFEYVSAPHYFGEILEWFGFAVACNFSTPSCAFLVFTACNLIPRAIAHHAWYQTVFADSYPAKRKAVIPFIW